MGADERLGLLQRGEERRVAQRGWGYSIVVVEGACANITIDE